MLASISENFRNQQEALIHPLWPCTDNHRIPKAVLSCWTLLSLCFVFHFFPFLFAAVPQEERKKEEPPPKKKKKGPQPTLLEEIEKELSKEIPREPPEVIICSLLRLWESSQNPAKLRIPFLYTWKEMSNSWFGRPDHTRFGLDGNMMHSDGCHVVWAHIEAELSKTKCLLYIASSVEREPHEHCKRMWEIKVLKSHWPRILVCGFIEGVGKKTGWGE